MNINDKELLVDELEEHISQVKECIPRSPFKMFLIEDNYKFILEAIDSNSRIYALDYVEKLESDVRSISDIIETVE